MLKKIQKILFYGNVSREEYEGIKKEIDRSNRGSLRIFSIVALIFLGVMLLLSLVEKQAAANRPVYAVAFILMLGICLEATVFYKKAAKLLNPCIFAFIMILFGFGIILGTVASAQEMSTTFVALVFTIPLLYVVRPVIMDGIIACAVVAFCIMARLNEAERIVYMDSMNAVIFGAMSAIISGYMVSVRIERLVYGKKVEMLSQTDLLTGLRNRNHYEQRIKEMPSSCRETLTCIYMDVNGLHNLNNTKGHAAGDAMLKFIAEQMIHYFGPDNSFRIGGDEFVAFLMDVNQERTIQDIQKMNEAVEKEGYHVSIGCETFGAAGLNMADLIKKAEEKMYAEKKQYYSQKGNSIRL